MSFLITEENTWHFYNNKDYAKKDLTVEQYGRLAKLIDDPTVDSININNAAPVTEIVIKVFGNTTGDHVLAEINSLFPMLEIGGESEWEFEGKPQPLFSCYDPDYSFNITIAVMPEDIVDGIGGN